MEAFLRYLKDYEVFIYLVIGILAAWQLRKFILAWEELRAAAFGLERESAQVKLNTAAAGLVILFVAAIGVYGLVTFLTPSLPGSDPLPTATVDLLATPTITLQPQASPPAAETAGTPEAAAAQAEISGCLPGEVMISSPENDQVVQGVVEVEGTADIPDFGFYKFEVAREGSENWLTIQAGDTFKQEEQLGFWDTTQLEPGPYKLRLVVFDNQGNQRDPCQVTLTVEPAPEG